MLQGTSSFDGRFAIVIYVGDEDEEAVKRIYSEVSEKFPNKPIKVISPPAEYYPNWAEIDETNINSFGDGEDRIKWRRKQNLGARITKVDYYLLVQITSSCGATLSADRNFSSNLKTILLQNPTIYRSSIKLSRKSLLDG